MIRQRLVWTLAIFGYVALYTLISRTNTLEQFGLRNKFSYLPPTASTFGDPPTVKEGTAKFACYQAINWTGIIIFYPVWAIDHYLLGGPQFMYK
jgi:hypothetical protein